MSHHVRFEETVFSIPALSLSRSAFSVHRAPSYGKVQDNPSLGMGSMHAVVNARYVGGRRGIHEVHATKRFLWVEDLRPSCVGPLLT